MIVAALAAVVALQAVQTTEAPLPSPVVTDLQIAELIGLTPGEVAERLGAEREPSANWAVHLVDGDQTVEIYPASRFWREPALHFDRPLRRTDALCASEFGSIAELNAPRADPATHLPRNRGLFAFVNNRLHSVRIDAPTPIVGSSRDIRALREEGRRRSVGSQWLVATGRLPLVDGVGVLGRFEAGGEPDIVMRSTCRTLPSRAALRSPSDDPGVALAFAVTILPVYLVSKPFMDAEDRRAEREGSALLERFALGAQLDRTPEQIVGRTRGVRVFRDPADPDYAVIAIKLGRRNNVHAPAMVGVRGDRVVWVASAEAADRVRLDDVLCMNSDGLLEDVRPGCSDYGYRP